MRLHENLWSRLIGEVEFAVARMKLEPSPFRKLYFFSGIFGEVSRLLNWQWDSDLALVHQVTQQTYQQLMARLNQPPEILGPMDSILLDELISASEQFSRIIQGRDVPSDQLLAVLARFAEVGYATSGNGNYLKERSKMPNLQRATTTGKGSTKTDTASQRPS